MKRINWVSLVLCSTLPLLSLVVLASTNPSVPLLSALGQAVSGFFGIFIGLFRFIFLSLIAVFQLVSPVVKWTVILTAPLVAAASVYTLKITHFPGSKFGNFLCAASSGLAFIVFSWQTSNFDHTHLVASFYMVILGSVGTIGLLMNRGPDADKELVLTYSAVIIMVGAILSLLTLVTVTKAGGMSDGPLRLAPDEKVVALAEEGDVTALEEISHRSKKDKLSAWMQSEGMTAHNYAERDGLLVLKRSSNRAPLVICEKTEGSPVIMMDINIRRPDEIHKFLMRKICSERKAEY